MEFGQVNSSENIWTNDKKWHLGPNSDPVYGILWIVYVSWGNGG